MISCSPRVRQEVEALFSADGDAATLSSDDLEFAKSKFCGEERERYQLSKYICDASGNIAGSFGSIAEKIEELLRNSSCAISQDNPINQVLDIELGLSLDESFSVELKNMRLKGLSKTDVENIRKELNDILSEVKKELNNGPDRTPQERLKLIYDVILKRGFAWADSNLLTMGLMERQLDCDTSAFIVMAVVHEFGWPVRLIEVPGHAFVRWDDGITVFNMDLGKIFPDDFYKKEFQVAYDFFAGSYDMISLAYFNRGGAKMELGRNEGAVKDYDEAIESNPNSADAYYNRGIAKGELGRYEEAIRDYNRAIKLNPKQVKAYNNRGTALEALGRHEEAVRSYSRAIMMDPNHAPAYYNRGLVKRSLGRDDDAAKDFKKAKKAAVRSESRNPNRKMFEKPNTP